MGVVLIFQVVFILYNSLVSFSSIYLSIFGLYLFLVAEITYVSFPVSTSSISIHFLLLISITVVYYYSLPKIKYLLLLF